MIDPAKWALSATDTVSVSGALRRWKMPGAQPRNDGRLALSIDDAARVLSVSRDSFERHVMKDVRVVRVGRRLLVPMSELEKWIDRSAATPLVAELSSIHRGRQRRRGRSAL